MTDISRRPRKPQALPLITAHPWTTRYHKEEDTYEFWFKKARSLTPEYFEGMSRKDVLPSSILTSLYPEIIALGPCAPTILKAFNTLKAADNYVKRENPSRSDPIRKEIEEYISYCFSYGLWRGEKQSNLGSFLHFDEPGDLYTRFEKGFEVIKTDSLHRNFTRTSHIGSLTASSIHMVSRGTTKKEKPAKAMRQAKSIVKALQHLEGILLKERIITPEHLTNITLPTKTVKLA